MVKQKGIGVMTVIKILMAVLNLMNVENVLKKKQIQKKQIQIMNVVRIVVAFTEGIIHPLLLVKMVKQSVTIMPALI